MMRFLSLLPFLLLFVVVLDFDHLLQGAVL